MPLRTTRGKERSLRISLPFPEIPTITPEGCCRTVRRGGMPIASRRAKLCVRVCCAATATYSMIEKNRAASLIGQLRTNSCPRLARTVIDQSPDQGFIHRAIPLRGADHFLDDHPVAIDHPALGHAGRLVGPLDGRRLVVQDVEAESQLAPAPTAHPAADAAGPPRGGAHRPPGERRGGPGPSGAGSPLGRSALPATNVSAPAA